MSETEAEKAAREQAERDAATARLQLGMEYAELSERAERAPSREEAANMTIEEVAERVKK